MKKSFKKSTKCSSKWSLIPFWALALMGLQSFNVNGQTLLDNDSLRPIQLKGVGITWTRPSGEEIFSSSVVNREEIKKSQGNGSINNLFDQIPSMITTSDAGTGIGYTYMRIRGIDQTRINVTINGIALNDAESQGSWFVNLPDFGTHVDNLQIQRGVGTSNNGAAAFGATMNFSTLSANPNPFLEITSSAGSFYTFRNTVSASTGLIKNRLSAAVSYSNIQSKGYIDRASANLNSLFFTTDYRLLSKDLSRDYGKLTFNLIYGNEKTGLAWNGVPSDSLKTNRTYNSCGEYYDANGNVHYYDNETDNYQQTHYQLFYSTNKKYYTEKLEHNFKIDVGSHLTRGLGYYENYKSNKSFEDYGLPMLVLEHDTLTQTDLIARKYLDNYFYGATFNIEHRMTEPSREGAKRNSFSWSLGGAVNRYQGDHYGNIIWMQYAGNIPINHRWYDGIGDKTQLNIFGTASYSLDENIYTYLDLQYRRINYLIDGSDDNLTNIFQDYIWNFFNPKLGFHYSWKGKQNEHLNQSVYGSFAMANREPTRADLIDSPNEKKPVPETLYDLELGYRLKTKNFAFNANYYFMYYKDQLILTGEINDVGAAIMTNVPQSYRTGLELIASYKPVSFFLWKINGTFSLNKILNYMEYVDNWDTWSQEQNQLGTTDISFSPSIVAANEFVFTPLKHFNIGFVTKFVSKQYLDNSSNDHYILKPYSTTNLNLSYEFHTKIIPEIGLFFNINNLFNAQYESNAWLYKYYKEGIEKFEDGYYTQAGINFLGGIRLKF